MTKTKTILLLLEHRENRRLLAESLTKFYTVLSPPAQGNISQFKALLEKPFDLCILDGRTLARIEPQLQQRRKAEQQVFLPVLLVVTRNKPAIANKQLWQNIDEIITTPIEKAELQTRIEILLRIRQFSLDLQIANQQLQEMNRLKSQFVSMVSHEFRNPLGAVSGFVQLIERQGNKLAPEKKESYFQLIHKSLKRLTSLVDDVLIIGRVGVGKLQYAPEPLDLEKFCRNLIAEIKFSRETSNEINFVVKIDDSPKPPNIEMDSNLLHHILSNILANAIKYSPENNPVNFTLSYQNNWAIFQIEDTGIGIPSEDQTQLFNSFYRATNVGQIPGTGLGLAIIKQCVDLHGGEIAVTSQEGKGTTFTVTLPLTCKMSV